MTVFGSVGEKDPGQTNCYPWDWREPGEHRESWLSRAETSKHQGGPGQENLNSNWRMLETKRAVQMTQSQKFQREPVMGRSPQNVPPGTWQGSHSIRRNFLCVSSKGREKESFWNRQILLIINDDYSVHITAHYTIPSNILNVWKISK